MGRVNLIFISLSVLFVLLMIGISVLCEQSIAIAPFTSMVKEHKNLVIL